MAYGFQVFDAAGNVVLDTTMRTGRILGTTTITGQSGQKTIAPVGGTPFVIIPIWPTPSQAGQFGDAKFGGSVTFDGQTITWAFSAGVGSDTTVYYGSY